MEYVDVSEGGIIPTINPADTAPKLRRPDLLRVGAYTMDTLSGTVRWRGEQLQLGQQERELLGMLLKRAGQIVSSDRLASMLNTTVAGAEMRMSALRDRLATAGVTWLPRKVNGCGYILWR